MHTKNIFSALAIVLCAILFIASALLLLVVSEGDGAIDPTYATLSATDEVKTFKTDMVGVDSLAFFVADEEHGGMHTLFKGLRPTVEIVGSDEDLIEISANASILEKVELIREGNTLVVQMREDCYKALENSEYSRGLYVECEVFTVKISGSIGKFATDAPVILDMNAAGLDEVKIELSDSICDAVITDLNASTLAVSSSGSARIKIAGKVEQADFDLRSDSRADLRELEAQSITKNLQSDPFGVSSVRSSLLPNLAFGGIIVTLLLLLVPLVLLVLTVMLLRRFIGLPMLPVVAKRSK